MLEYLELFVLDKCASIIVPNKSEYILFFVYSKPNGEIICENWAW